MRREKKPEWRKGKIRKTEDRRRKRRELRNGKWKEKAKLKSVVGLIGSYVSDVSLLQR